MNQANILDSPTLVISSIQKTYLYLIKYLHTKLVSIVTIPKTSISYLFFEVIIMAAIDFSIRVETEDDPYGPMVIVVRTLFNGMVEKVRMQAALAADSVLSHPGNGVVYRSAYIVFSGVYDD